MWLDGKSYYLGAANDGQRQAGEWLVQSMVKTKRLPADECYGADGAALENNWLKVAADIGITSMKDGVVQTDVAERLTVNTTSLFGTENDGENENRMAEEWSNTWALLRVLTALREQAGRRLVATGTTLGVRRNGD